MNREFVLPFQVGNNKHGLVPRISKLLISLVLAWMRQSPKSALKSNQWNGLVVYSWFILSISSEVFILINVRLRVAHGTYSNKVKMGYCCACGSVNHRD